MSQISAEIDTETEVCLRRDTCSHLKAALAERDYLRGRVNELEPACDLAANALMMKDEEIASLQPTFRNKKWINCGITLIAVISQVKVYHLANAKVYHPPNDERK